jgi:hypothetical protein
VMGPHGAMTVASRCPLGDIFAAASIDQGVVAILVGVFRDTGSL